MNADQREATIAEAKRVLDNLELEIAFRGMMARSFDDPDTVGIEQETEMRHAFFGGAKVCLDFLEHSGMTIESLRDECATYIRGVKAGLR